MAFGKNVAATVDSCVQVVSFVRESMALGKMLLVLETTMCKW